MPRVTYAHLFATVDRRFLAFGALGRLAPAMYPLGVLLYVAAATESYSRGGFALAVLSVGSAVGGPCVGVLSDRLGQRPVAIGATAVSTLAVIGLLLVGPHASLPLLTGFVGVMGLANPQVGAMARARWPRFAPQNASKAQFNATAMAYESAVDETAFVVGPIAVSSLAGLVNPAAGLIAALTVALVGQTGFALHPSSQRIAKTSRADEATRATFPLVPFIGLVMTIAAVGMVFGSSQTGVAARMTLNDSESLTGLVYAGVGVGSAVTGLLTTRLPHRFALPWRIVVAGALLICSGFALAAFNGTVTTGIACILVGISLAPAMVSSYALAQVVAPVEWRTTVMTALGTATVAGVGVGAAIAGRMVDVVGPDEAVLLVCAAGLLVMVGGWLAGRKPGR